MLFQLSVPRSDREAILNLDMASGNDLHYDEEKTSVFETFFFPEKDIVNTDLVKKVQLRYNYANVLYRILHGYELFCRKSSDDSLATRRDSMNLIIQDCPVIPHSFLQRAIPDKSARIIAEKLLVSYQVRPRSPRIRCRNDTRYRIHGSICR